MTGSPEHFESFRVHPSSLREGERLPRFVETEFRDSLRCGSLAGGLARFQCGTAAWIDSWRSLQGAEMLPQLRWPPDRRARGAPGGPWRPRCPRAAVGDWPALPEACSGAPVDGSRCLTERARGRPRAAVNRSRAPRHARLRRRCAAALWGLHMPPGWTNASYPHFLPERPLVYPRPTVAP